MQAAEGTDAGHPPRNPPLSWPPEVSEEQLRHDLTRLASDEMEGRRIGTPGLLLATRMLEQRFAAIGLEPSGDDGYRQGFRATVGTDLGSGNRMTLTLPGGQVRELQVETDFLPLSFSDSGDVSGAEVVFAGYGIQAPDLGYDDYDGLDVDGKLVLILRDEPQENEEDSPFAGKIPSSHSNLRFKAVTARERGAAGILLITGPLYHADPPHCKNESAAIRERISRC